MGNFISGYRNLIVWIEAKKLTLLVYRLTNSFPKSEEFGSKKSNETSSGFGA